jgi:CRISPR type III-A-associated RAMP protein Csm4
MQPAVLVRLRPSGPWRSGPAEGGHTRVDELFRSDRLFSAVTLAMKQLGHLEEWLASTAEAAQPQVTFTSLFPYQGDLLFAPPPATLWPPPTSLVVSPSPVFLSKIRWQAARLVPLPLIESLLTGQSILADQWLPDVESGCLLRRDRPSSSPFRTRMRSHAAVDRVNASVVDMNSLACVEFESGSGLWCIGRFNDENAASVWKERVEAAFRLLADTGFGARRSSGWGHAERPEFQPGEWPRLIFPKLRRNYLNGDQEQSASYWLLSLYSPGPADMIDWRSGDYKLTARGGFVAANGVPSAQKKSVRLVSEGSVLLANSEPVGTAVNVAPDGFPHPVYRNGFALALKLPPAGEAEPPPVVESAEPVSEGLSQPVGEEAAESAGTAMGPTVEDLREPTESEAAEPATEAEVAESAVIQPESDSVAPQLAPLPEAERATAPSAEDEPGAAAPPAEQTSEDPETARSVEADEHAQAPASGEPAEVAEPVRPAESAQPAQPPGETPPARENEGDTHEI